MIYYIIFSIISGIWSVIRQTQRWSGNSIDRLLLVFLLNTIFAPITLIISIYNRNLLPNGKPAVPIGQYKKENKNNNVD